MDSMNVKKKKVIFIGGTAYSGSTFFDLILSNDPKGFSCGEVRGLFNPSQPYHINPLCGCGRNDCSLWQNVLKGGKTNLYTNIFVLTPHVEFIVDSSKDPYWIQSQAKNLLSKGIECKHILIWKSPLEFAHSCKKRGKIDWHKAWMNYHRMYLTAIKNWRSVKYSDLANNSHTLRKICNYLKIPYFSTKSNYWDKKHHILFGNVSAKTHLETENQLYDEVSEDKSDNTFDQDSSYTINRHRTIYYTNVNDNDLKKNVELLISGDIKLQKMLMLLNERDIKNDYNGVYSNYNLDLSRINFYLRKTKRLTIRKLRRYRNQFAGKFNDVNKNI
jgi:hypothetical protein